MAFIASADANHKQSALPHRAALHRAAPRAMSAAEVAVDVALPSVDATQSSKHGSTTGHAAAEKLGTLVYLLVLIALFAVFRVYGAWLLAKKAKTVY